MRAMQTLTWSGVALALVVAASGCRPRLFPLLEAPDNEAHALLKEVRLAHSGGRQLLSLRCTREDQYRPGLGELWAPELGPAYVARSGLDFPAQAAWQVAYRGDNRIAWYWDGTALRTERDGRGYTPWPGVDRAAALQDFMLLVHPADAAVRERLDVVLLPRAGGRLRLGLRRDGEMVTLEIHPRTFLVEAVESTIPLFGRSVRRRAELEDYRDVGDSVMVPHRIREFLGVGPAWMPVRVTRLWDVQAVVDSAYPKPLQLPGVLDQPVQHPELPPVPPQEPPPIIPVSGSRPG